MGVTKSYANIMSGCLDLQCRRRAPHRAMSYSSRVTRRHNSTGCSRRRPATARHPRLDQGSFFAFSARASVNWPPPPASPPHFCGGRRNSAKRRTNLYCPSLCLTWIVESHVPVPGT